MKNVIIESPYKAKIAIELIRNRQYAFLCLKDCYSRGEAGFASHLLYTNFLNEDNPEERKAGIEMGLNWGVSADITAVYVDYGITEGMKYGIQRANDEGRPVEYRKLGIMVNCNLEGLAKEVAEFFAVDSRDLSDKIRNERISLCRHIYFKCARQLFPTFTLKMIGNVINRSDTAVFLGIKSIDEKYYKKAEYKKFCKAKHIEII